MSVAITYLETKNGPGRQCFSPGRSVTNPPVRRARLLVSAIVAFAAAGAWISGELLKQHAGMWNASSGHGNLFVRACLAVQSAGFDCAAALQSGWAVIKVPVPWLAGHAALIVNWIAAPVALLGLCYFAFFGVWFFLSGGHAWQGSFWRRFPVYIARGGAIGSAFYLGVMAFGGSPWCLWCIATHLVNFILLLGIERLSRSDIRSGADDHDNASKSPACPGWTSRDALRTACVAAMVVAGICVYYHDHVVLRNALAGLRPYERLVTSMRNDPAFLLREFYAQKRADIPPRENDCRDENEPRLVVFTDFECPGCRCNAKSLRAKVAPAFGGRLAIEVRHFPLCGSCNHGVSGDFHPHACDAARAAEAARALDGENGFGRMSELLFDNRTRLGAQLYPRLARQIGLDVDRFQAAMAGDAVSRAVQSDIELGRQLGVKGTPAMFLDGRPVPELCQTPTFWEAVANREPSSLILAGAAAGEQESTQPGQE